MIQSFLTLNAKLDKRTVKQMQGLPLAFKKIKIATNWYYPANNNYFLATPGFFFSSERPANIFVYGFIIGNKMYF